MIFDSNKKSKILILTVRNGKVIKKDIFNNEEAFEQMELSSLKIDSSKELVEEAKEKYNLLFGTGYIHGFHFSLEKSDDYLFLTVVGTDRNNQLKKVHFDASNGNYLGMSETIQQK